MKNSKITKENIKHLSNLANLKLTDKDLDKFPKQLSEILDYFKSLNQLDTKEIEPIAQTTGLENLTRGDKPEKSLDSDQVLSNAKNKHKNFFVTKAVLEK